MALTKSDLGKIEALMVATVEASEARIQHQMSLMEARLDTRIKDEIRSVRFDLEAIKQMMIEDAAAAAERMDGLEARITVLEKRMSIAR